MKEIVHLYKFNLIYLIASILYYYMKRLHFIYIYRKLTCPTMNQKHVQSMIATVHQNIIHKIFNKQLVIGKKLPTLPLLTSASKESLDKHSPLKMVRSEYSEDEKKKTKQLKLEMEMFEKSLQKKTEQLRLEQLKISQFQKSVEESELKEQMMKHRGEALKRKQRRWQTQRIQQVTLEQHKKIEKSLSSKRRLYKQVEMEFKKQQEQQQKARNEMIVLIAKQKRGLVDIKAISQHERSYVNYLQQNKKERARKLQQIKDTANKIAAKEERRKLKSKFYQRVAQQINNEKKQAEEIESLKYEHKRRIKTFLEHLRSKPNFNISHRATKRANSISQVQPQKKKRGLSYTQLHKLGNQFMKQGLLKISKTSSAPRVNLEINQKNDELKGIDYLRMMRERRLKMGSSHQSMNILTIHDVKIKKILASNLPHEEKLQRLKKMAYKLEASPQSDKPYLQIQKIEAKLKILDATMLSQT